MRQFRYLALLGLTSLALSAGLAATPVAAQTPAPAATPAPAPAAVTPAKLDYDSLAFARQATNWFYSSELDSLWAHTDPGLQQNMGTKEKWTEMIGEFIQRAGMEESVVEERWVKRNGQRQYWRVLRATEFTQEPVVLRWALLPGRMISGLGMNPLSRVPPIDPN